ncbi:MAG: glycosyltransferase, partial [Candidatus Magasanikbacteria bacterium]|nr:glycosyltransferase [Candidatus Magasanikbacteria bacterium]
LTAKTVSKLMVHNAKAYLVTSFFKTSVTHPRTYLFPPILRKEVLETKPTVGNFILVYTTSNFSSVIDVLKKINAQFIIYGVGEHLNEDNLIFKLPSQVGFLKDLASCQAIFATAGLSLISEALHLGKPYLAMPVKGQFEQILNAYYLEKLGYGKFLQKITKENIESFLSDMGIYRENLLKYKKEDNQKIFSKLDNLIKQYSLKN